MDRLSKKIQFLLLLLLLKKENKLAISDFQFLLYYIKQQYLIFQRFYF